METNYADNNPFIDLFEKFYDKTQEHKIDFDNIWNNIKEQREKEELMKNEKKSFFDKFKKKEVIKYDLPEDFVASYNDIKNYLDDILSKPAQDFWILWRLCQFIRWAEKVLLYKNDPGYCDAKLTIFVDSAINAEEREFVFTVIPGTKVFIKMELIQKPYVKITESAYNEVLTIIVERSFGKKMENKFVVINGESELLDDGDLYLINQINKHLNFVIRNSIKTIYTEMLSDITLFHKFNNKDLFNNPLEDFNCGYYGKFNL